MLSKNINAVIALITYDYRKRYNKRLSVKKLQALLYLSQGVALAVYDQPMFADDIVANEHYGYWIKSVGVMFIGHVTVANHKSLIRKYKKFIDKAYECLRKHDDSVNAGKIANVVFTVMNAYSSWTALELENQMFSYDDSPLVRVLDNYNPELEDYSDYDFVIPKQVIRIWFKEHVVQMTNNNKLL